MNQAPEKDGGRAPLRPNGPADAETLKLVDELKALAADTLGRGIERMFDGADDMLFEMARRATNNKDQRVYFDTMRVVRLGRPKIGGIFRDHIRSGFSLQDESFGAPEPPMELEELSLQESRSLEESIAVKSMASKAEGLYAPVLFELGRRIEWMIKQKNAPIADDALSPAKISDAFRRSAETLDVEFDIELVIFKLFDRLVISELGDLYARVIRFLDEKGVKPAAVSGQRPRGAGPVVGGGTPAAAAGNNGPAPTADGEGIVGGSYQFTTPPMMDAGTLASLRQMGSGPAVSGGANPSGGGYGYADAQLSAELATAASGQVVPGWEAPRAYAYVQRAGAVGQMFNDLMQDPTLPAPLKPRFDQLRFSVIKSALRDTSFFSDNKHPVRGLMNELTTLAASARASGMEALQRIEELVGQIQGQFDVAAEEVRSQTALPGKVDEKTLDKFFSQQKEEARQRRQAIIERTRRVVAEELQLQLLGRKIPDGMRPLLNSGWAPLAALRLLKQGADSEGWTDAMALLKRLLESVDPRRPAARSTDRLRELETDTRTRLGEVGMIEDRINALMGSWRESLAEVEADAAALAPPQPEAAPTPTPVAGEDVERVTETEVAAEPAESDASDVPDSTPTPPAPAPADDESEPPMEAPDANTLLDLLMVLSSWFRVYDHDRGQNRWLKVVAHHPADQMVTFAEFNGQNKLQVRTSVFLDDLVANRAEPIDLGPAARRSLDAYLAVRRSEGEAADQTTH